MSNNWEEIGKIVRLQVQVRSMKRLEDGVKYYQPEVGLLATDHLHVDQHGASAVVDGETIIDKHNATHPISHHNGTNPLSFGFTPHYSEMQAKFGEHVGLGIAGENIIVETERILTDDDFTGEVVVRRADGQIVVVEELYAMPPCEPFTRFCLQLNAPGENAPAVKEGLQFLHGRRGYVGQPTNDTPITINVGDTVLVRRAD